MDEKQKQSTVKVRIETGQEIKFLSDKSGLSQTQLLAEVFDALFNIAVTFKSINFEYEYDVTNAQVTISIHGKRNLEIGSFNVPSSTDSETVDKMIKKKVKP